MNIFNMLDRATEKLKEINPETVKLVKRTVTADATDEELALFMYMCYRYNLDPLLGEIYFMKAGKHSKPSFIVSRDGYLKIAMSNPEYQGLNSFVVKEGDEFEIDAEKGTVRHRFGTKRGEILGAWAVAYRKGFKPQIAFVDFKEYFKPKSQAWKEYPSAMIQKVAEVFVLRRQFNITGVVAREEIDTKLPTPTAPPTITETEREVVLEGIGSTRPEPQAEDSDTPKLKITLTPANRDLAMALKRELEDKGEPVNGENIYRLAKKKFEEGELSKEDFDRIKTATTG